METILEKIMRETGRVPVSCQCPVCKMHCHRAACLGTPQDIMAIIEAGYQDKLCMTLWMSGMVAGYIPFPIPMVQAKHTPNGCIFFEKGLCVLHEAGLKPTEGRLSYHILTEENFIFTKNLTWNVAKEWINVNNLPLIISILKTLDSRNDDKKRHEDEEK